MPPLLELPVLGQEQLRPALLYLEGMLLRHCMQQHLLPVLLLPLHQSLQGLLSAHWQSALRGMQAGPQAPVLASPARGAACQAPSLPCNIVVAALLALPLAALLALPLAWLLAQPQRTAAALEPLQGLLLLHQVVMVRLYLGQRLLGILDFLHQLTI